MSEATQACDKRDLLVRECLSIEDLPHECISDCSHSGACDDDVAHWLKELAFTVDRVKAISCLRGYGAWDAEELAASTDDELAARILWLACGDFSEWDGTESSPCGSDVFCLDN